MILALLAILACSCATEPAEPIVARHQYLPLQLEMHYLPSSFFGGRTELVFKDGYLVRQQYARKEQGGSYKNVISKTEYFVPTEDQWQAFWIEMEQLGIWQWKARYRPEDIGAEVYEGGGWHLLLAFQGKAVDTSGNNAGPEPEDPSKTAIGPDSWDRQLESAISRLIEERS